MIKKLIYKLLTYLRTTVYPAFMVYLLIAYFNWDILDRKTKQCF